MPVRRISDYLCTLRASLGSACFINDFNLSRTSQSALTAIMATQPTLGWTLWQSEGLHGRREPSVRATP